MSITITFDSKTGVVATIQFDKNTTNQDYQRRYNRSCSNASKL